MYASLLTSRSFALLSLFCMVTSLQVIRTTDSSHSLPSVGAPFLLPLPDSPLLPRPLGISRHCTRFANPSIVAEISSNFAESPALCYNRSGGRDRPAFGLVYRQPSSRPTTPLSSALFLKAPCERFFIAPFSSHFHDQTSIKPRLVLVRISTRITGHPRIPNLIVMRICLR